MRIPLALIATASIAGSLNATELYTHIGTEGLGIGLGTGLSQSIGLRAEVSYGRLSRDFTVSEIDYDAKIRLRGAGIYGDWFPGTSPFRLTAGLNFNDSRVDATGTSETTLIINGRQFSAVGEAVYATIEWPSVMPYVGVGYGHALAFKGWRMFGDLGVMVGKPKTRLTATPGLLSQVASEDLEAERRQLQDKADDYRLYPVLKIGVGYTF